MDLALESEKWEKQNKFEYENRPGYVVPEEKTALGRRKWKEIENKAGKV